ncbi:MAG: hypothetical protein HZA34_04900 [Candidatus Pacebacteria bacterium]|nr:hypothetical protein [Candidatus Paceibacterota bacterium]
MNIYFSAAMTRYRKMLPMYMSLAEIIKDLGHTITSHHVIDPKTTDGDWIRQYKPEQLWQREVERLQNSDVLISEVTTPSYGVAFMMDEALNMKKPQLSLYYALPFQQDNLPLMLRGKPGIYFQMYTEDTARVVISDFFKSLG